MNALGGIVAAMWNLGLGGDVLFVRWIHRTFPDLRAVAAPKLSRTTLRGDQAIGTHDRFYESGKQMRLFTNPQPQRP
jgi:hypothetical protein